MIVRVHKKLDPTLGVAGARALPREELERAILEVTSSQIPFAELQTLNLQGDCARL